jgi:hypothetical protein
MTKQLQVLLLIALLCSTPQGARAESKPLEMKWGELAALIGGHHAALLLTDGTTVKGEVVAVREEEILMDVSSAVKGYPKGSGSVPRTSLVSIDVVRTRGAWGRTMGTVIGVLGGMTFGGYLAVKGDHSPGAGLATFLGVASGVGIAGYYTGRALDRRVTRVKIVP